MEANVEWARPCIIPLMCIVHMASLQTTYTPLAFFRFAKIDKVGLHNTITFNNKAKNYMYSEA